MVIFSDSFFPDEKLMDVPLLLGMFHDFSSQKEDFVLGRKLDLVESGRWDFSVSIVMWKSHLSIVVLENNCLSDV